MDVNPQAVAEIMRQHGAQRLIHGHTHRPADHELQLDGRTLTRHVLGDWRSDGADILCLNGEGLKRLRVTPDSAGTL
jgi:UDP-2,3-diacylglucosamine hydrolase